MGLGGGGGGAGVSAIRFSFFAIQKWLQITNLSYI